MCISTVPQTLALTLGEIYLHVTVEDKHLVKSFSSAHSDAVIIRKTKQSDPEVPSLCSKVSD